MAEITANLIKDLRERTGAGMADCKKALVEVEGDLEKAIDFLRKKGLAKAAKKAGREATEGAIISYIHGGGRIGVLLEVNCETDFVAREKDVRLAQAKESGKPDAVIQKVVDGQISKWLKEIALLDQPWVKDDKK